MLLSVRILGGFYSKPVSIIIFLFLFLNSSTVSAQASDYILIPHSMTYNVDAGQDEYIAYIFNVKNKTFERCKAVYKLIDNKLTAQKCSGPIAIPFSLAFDNNSDIQSTIVFTRAANRQNAAVFGPDGIWHLDEGSGEVEFCVFGDITSKCVVLSRD